jgi:hypothetical protein
MIAVPAERTRNTLPLPGHILRSTIDGKDFEFEADSTYHMLRDKATGSFWKFPAGVSAGGKLEGSKLEEISVTYAFWFAWSSFHPNTAVVD